MRRSIPTGTSRPTWSRRGSRRTCWTTACPTFGAAATRSLSDWSDNPALVDPADDRLGGGRGRTAGDQGAPAAGAVQCDGTDEVPVPQQSRRLSPRHARARPAARDGRGSSAPAASASRTRRGWRAGCSAGCRPRRHGRAEQQVPLPSPVAVYITYLTAAPDGDRIAFREDVYGRDSAPRRQSAEVRLPFL